MLTPGGTGGVEGLGSAVSRMQGEYASNQKDATLEQLLSIKSYVDSPEFDMDVFIERVSEELAKEEEEKKKKKGAKKTSHVTKK